MARERSASGGDNRILVKLRPSASSGAAEGRAALRPLRAPVPGAPPRLALAGEAQWYLAELPDGAATPWDLAHARVADQLGVAESDVLFAEPDLVHDVFVNDGEGAPGRAMAVGDDCAAEPPSTAGGRVAGPAGVVAWHLGDDFTQLQRARDAVAFTDRRTRIAHLDTGYYAAHVTTPARVLHLLEADFADGPPQTGSAQDPNHRKPLDNAGHGTGTLSILAGRTFAQMPNGEPLGGAWDADVVPIRIADYVELLRTSAFASALDYAVDVGCDVLSMSMGGLPSNAWRDSVDRAYLAGLTMVTAAGNCIAPGVPTIHVVYPARYARVIAACGVMANGRAYTGLSVGTMEGNFGPQSVMAHALAAYSPNIPWARFGCPQVVRLNGEGTSAATPQVAAAATLWLEKHKQELPRDWRRVEAVRHALFRSAKGKGDASHLGNGVIQALAALDVRPELSLPQSKSDSDSFAFLRVLTGLGIAEVPAREEMFNLELRQRWLVNATLRALVPDPDAVRRLDDRTLREVMDAVIADEGASLALRKHVASRYPTITGRSAPETPRVVSKVLAACDAEPALRPPPYRRLRVYAVDPSFSTRLDTAAVNETTLQVHWEELEPGPVGEYLRVVDEDAAGTTYAPVALDAPSLLAQDGWAPSEGNAQFHQQMVYAVATTTIEFFERALGRPVLWRQPEGGSGRFVRQLSVRPHALAQANAYYSPDETALLFGYFDAAADDPGDHMPGSRVYSCLSHDIVAHETTHAILDGMHRRFNEPTNVDVLAFHEGFADIVALLQHFTIRDVLRREIARTRGDLEAESMLGSLAVQFGRATGGRGALREAIGRVTDGVWRRLEPDPTELARRVTPHSRGAILVAAVFDAFLAIYRTRTADLLRIATGGTGTLPAGAVHPDLVDRLADEAAKSAEHVLTMCIRAIDYLPPVDVTFFEYLRALITADFDLVADDRFNYRVAFVESFRRRGIYPLDLSEPGTETPRTLSVDTLRWQGAPDSIFARRVQPQYERMLAELKTFADRCLYVGDREELWTLTTREREKLKRQLTGALRATPGARKTFGIDPAEPFELAELRPAARSSPNGKRVPQLIAALVQERAIDADARTGTPSFTFRGGATLVVDLTSARIEYVIRKHVASRARLRRTADFVRATAADPLRALFFSAREPFAALHALADDVR